MHLPKESGSRERIKPLLRGNIYQIPLSDGRFAYCQYLATQSQYPDPIGKQCAFFRQIFEKPVDVEQIDMTLLFCPLLFVQLSAAIKEASWTLVGRKDPLEYDLPTYRHTPQIVSGQRGKLRGWMLISPSQRTYVDQLPDECRELEFYWSSGYVGLDRRLRTGSKGIDDEIF